MERKSIDEMTNTPKRKPSGAAVIRQDLTESLFRALFEEWACCGFNGISLERVANRVGAGKGAIYRRWDSKIAFATEALETVQIRLTEISDNGSLTADLLAFMTTLRRVLRHRLVRRILPDLYAERARGEKIGQVIERMADYRRQQGRAIITRAIARRELPATIDSEMALDMIPSAVYWRIAIREQRLTNDDLPRLAVALTAALQTL